MKLETYSRLIIEAFKWFDKNLKIVLFLIDSIKFYCTSIKYETLRMN